MKRSATLLLYPSFVSVSYMIAIESSLTWTFFMKEPPPPLPPVMADKITRMKSASDNLKIPIPIDMMASRESLRAAVHASSRNLADIESRGDSL
jgi:hypothetical protein